MKKTLVASMAVFAVGVFAIANLSVGGQLDESQISVLVSQLEAEATSSQELLAPAPGRVPAVSPPNPPQEVQPPNPVDE